MKKRFWIYFLHSLQGQFWGFHFLLVFLIALKLESSLRAPLELNPKFLVLGRTNFLYHEKCFENISLKMIGARSLLSLKNSAVRICRFLMCIGTDLYVCKKFFKRWRFITVHFAETSFQQKLFLLIVRLWNIHIKGQ